MRSPLPIFAGLLAATVAATPAWSRCQPSAPVILTRVVVHAGDLNLSLTGDVDVLLRRLSRAAARACADTPSFSPLALQMSRSFQVCKADALARTVATVPFPLVRERYAQAVKARTIRLAGT